MSFQQTELTINVKYSLIVYVILISELTTNSSKINNGYVIKGPVFSILTFCFEDISVPSAGNSKTNSG